MLSLAIQVGDLVKDWRRMNVSFTRARSKLIIFGSRKTLQSAPLLSEFFNLMDSKKWILALPPNADQMHSHIVHPIVLKSAGSPGKRCAGKMEEEKMAAGKENSDIATPVKKIKRSRAQNGVLRGRPILQDVVNGEK
jgi:DNA replication ATP-dependent helicase Dna2